MYAINITRTNDEVDYDMLLGKDSMDAKNKVINYIKNFCVANYNLNIDNDLLDQNLNIELFSLQNFLLNNFNIDIDKDLIIRSIPTDKEHCLFVSFFNEKIDDYPSIYILEKNDINKARKILAYMVNNELILENKDNLNKYRKEKISFNNDIDSYTYAGVKCNIISLYKNGLFMEELLDNALSYNQLKNNKLEFEI